MDPVPNEPIKHTEVNAAGQEFTVEEAGSPLAAHDSELPSVGRGEAAPELKPELMAAWIQQNVNGGG